MSIYLNELASRALCDRLLIWVEVGEDSRFFLAPGAAVSPDLNPI